MTPRADLYKLAMPTVLGPPALLYSWSDRWLYIGPFDYVGEHVHGSVVIHVGLYEAFQVRMVGDDWVTCRCSIVPAGVPHELILSGHVLGVLFIEPESPSFYQVQRRYPYRGDRITYARSASTVACVRQVYERACDDVEAVGYRIDQLLKPDLDYPTGLDGRTVKAMRLIRAHADENISHTVVAQYLNISPSHFLHLFRAEAGVPFRRFRMWTRLVRATSMMRGSQNLTVIAADNGFTDSAHFSRCFRDTFGIQPSYIHQSVNGASIIRP